MPNAKADAFTSPRTARRIWSFVRGHALAIWLAVVPLLTVALIVRHWQEVGEIGQALRDAHPRWIVAGIGIEVVTVVVSALTYRILLRRLGHRLSCLTLAGAHLRRVALGAIFVVSGPASVYVFLRILKQRRVPVDDGLLTIALRSVAGQGAFVVVFAAALAIHGANHVLAAFGGALALAFALAPLVRLHWRRRLPWLRRLPYGLGDRAAAFLTRLRGHRLAVRDLGWPVLLMLVCRLGPIGLLFASLRALEVEATPRVAITAYLAALLAHTMVPVFHGAGVVEAAAAVALEQSGVPAETAVGVALLWRLMDFWLVLAIGLALHAASSFGPRGVALPATIARSSRANPAEPATLTWRPALHTIPVTSAAMRHASRSSQSREIVVN